MLLSLKRTSAFFMAAMLLCTATACSSSSQNLQIVQAPSEAPEYLSFFSPNTFTSSDTGKYWSDYFAQTYNRKVFVSYDGANYYSDEGLSYRELLEKRLQSSMPDDLYIINAEDVIAFEQKGYWMDLSDMDFVNNISDAALYQSTYNGKVFSVPLSFTGFGFYWNVTLLKEHGLEIPQNLTEFLSVCEALKQAGILPYGANKGYALTVPAMCAGLSALYGSEDKTQRINALNSGETPISSYMRDGFALVEMMIANGYLDPQQALDTAPDGEWDLFLSGGCAFVCIGMTAALGDEQKNGLELVLAGVPVLENGAVSVYGAIGRLCVNPASKNLETALEFIEMVGAKQALDTSAMLEKALSCAKDSDIVVSEDKQMLGELLQQPGQIPNQDFALHFNTWESIRNVCREICGGASVEEACAMLDELQATELEAYTGK